MKSDQYEALSNAIRTGRFIRNSIIRGWIDGEVKSRNDGYKYCKILADNPEFPWTKQLNSMARQAHAERDGLVSNDFIAIAKRKQKVKKGFPKYKKHTTRASVEYKTSGWVRFVLSKWINPGMRGGSKRGIQNLWNQQLDNYVGEIPTPSGEEVIA